MTDTTPPEGLETKDLPRGYGHAGVPAPDVLAYSETTDSLHPAPTVNAPATDQEAPDVATPAGGTPSQAGTESAVGSTMSTDTGPSQS